MTKINIYSNMFLTWFSCFTCFAIFLFFFFFRFDQNTWSGKCSRITWSIKLPAISDSGFRHRRQHWTKKGKVHGAYLDSGRANLLNDRCSSRKLSRSTTATMAATSSTKKKNKRHKEDAQLQCVIQVRDEPGGITVVKSDHFFNEVRISMIFYIIQLLLHH